MAPADGDQSLNSPATAAVSATMPPSSSKVTSTVPSSSPGTFLSMESVAPVGGLVAVDAGRGDDGDDVEVVGIDPGQRRRSLEPGHSLAQPGVLIVGHVQPL